jgi:hypothetical protein
MKDIKKGAPYRKITLYKIPKTPNNKKPAKKYTKKGSKTPSIMKVIFFITILLLFFILQ